MGAPLIGEIRWSYLVTLIFTSIFSLLFFVVPGLTYIYIPWEGMTERTAYLIGAAYVGAAIYYILVLRRNRWPEARYGLGGLVIFSLVLLVATAFDWDRFSAYHPVTLAWLALYYFPPIGYPILYRAQITRGRAAEAGSADISPAWRLWLILRGAVYALLAVAGIFSVGVLVDAWPWGISALEIRIFMGQLALQAWAGFVALRDVRWRHLRLSVLLNGTFGAAQLLGLLIGSDPYNWSSPLAVALPLMFLEWLLTAVAMLAIYRDR